MQLIFTLLFRRFRIFTGGTRARNKIIPTYDRAGMCIIPTRASYEISPTTLYLSLKKIKEGKHESNRL